MSYSPAEHKELQRTRMLRLLDAGPGAYEYAIDAAARAEKDDPMLLRGLGKFVSGEIEKRNAEARQCAPSTTTSPAVPAGQSASQERQHLRASASTVSAGRRRVAA